MCKRNDQCLSVAYFVPSEVGSPHVPVSRVYTHSFLWVLLISASFGLKLYGLLFADVFLPLIAVVHPGIAQQTWQLVLSLCVVLNQLSHGIEFSLAFLQHEFPFTGVFNKVGDRS